MNTNTTSEKPFFKCDIENCNFLGDASLTECPMCNARKERSQWFDPSHYNPYNFIIIFTSILLTYLFFGSIWGGPLFSFYNYIIVCLSIIISKLIIEPITRKIYLFIKEKKSK